MIKKKIFTVLCVAMMIACVGCDLTHDKNTNQTLDTVSVAEKTPLVITSTSSVDYSKNENWAIYENNCNKKVDVFLICPTVDMGENGNKNLSLEDKKVKENFVGALNMERGIYEDEANIIAPFYRQITFPTYSDASMELYYETAYQDVKAAFIQFIENTDENRPFIIAGFSQGSQIAVDIMKEFMQDVKLQKRLVAAYVIGWRVTEDDLIQYPWLKMASGESDTGVIVSFNSEAEGVTDSLMVPKDTKTLGINPLNWKTDRTVADAELNLGACFTDYSATIKEEIPALCGAYLDENRGTLIVTSITPEQYPGVLFEDGVYHLYDYQFFYRNLQKNVKTRIYAFINKN